MRKNPNATRSSFKTCRCFLRPVKQRSSEVLKIGNLRYSFKASPIVHFSVVAGRGAWPKVRVYSDYPHSLAIQEYDLKPAAKTVHTGKRRNICRNSGIQVNGYVYDSEKFSTSIYMYTTIHIYLFADLRN